MASSISRTILSRIGKRVDNGAGHVLRYGPAAFTLFSLYCAFSLVDTYYFGTRVGDGPSMYPTIPDGNNFSGNDKRYRHGNGIQVGDVVQIRSPIIPGRVYGKRIIGMPGDYILRSKPQSAAPGGAPVPGITDWKKRLGNKTVISDLDEEEWDEPEMIRVPEGHVWIEGDNQAWSRDSREFGPVPLALVDARTSWICVGNRRFQSLNPGKGLRKVEADEMLNVLGPD